jgi:energy-coupling factor transporter ATP-binding protein EcfA2
MAKIRLKTLTFSDGSVVEVSDILVLVGPNNAGKSRALKDVDHLLHGQIDHVCRVVRQLEIDIPESIEELVANTGIDAAEQGPNVILRSLESNLRQGHAPTWGNMTLAEQDKYFPRDRTGFLRTLGGFIFSHLGTEERLAIVKRSPSGDMDAPPNNALQYLYRVEGAEDRLNEAFTQVFNTRLRLDVSRLTELMLRIGDDVDKVTADTKKALHEFKAYEILDEQGDGMRSFAAVSLALDVVQRPIALIDEPEAFLHPPQARQLGRHVAATRDGQQILIATHSTDFLRGLLSGEASVKIIRITRSADVNYTTVIDTAMLRSFADDPLLGSARIIDGLFYQGVVVCEADADRAFYEAIGLRLYPDNNIHYTHAHNKQTIFRAIKAYRNMGVRCASIVDIDIVNSNELPKLLEAHGTSEELVHAIEKLRSAVSDAVGERPAKARLTLFVQGLKDVLEKATSSSADPERDLASLEREIERVKASKSAWRDLKARGVDALNGSAQESLLELIRLCADRGLFIVPAGELEAWLRGSADLPERDKRQWIVGALDALRSLQVDQNAQAGRFVASVHAYLEKEHF